MINALDAPASVELDLLAPPPITEFLLDESDIRLIMGPRGELKTSGSYLAWLIEGQVSPPESRPYRVIVVRDTWTNLERTTIETLREYQRRGLRVIFSEGDREAIVGGNLVHCFFLGMDHLKDLNKFQGFGAAGLWIEEPAPAALNDIGAGLPAEVLGIGWTSLRQPGVRHRAIISLNPPDEDHWTLQLGPKVAALKRIEGKAPLTFREFRIPKGTNPWISDEDRAQWRAALELVGRGDLVQRLSEGRPGFVVQGEEATPEYSDTSHVAKSSLQPLERVEIIRLWDFGLTPVCVWSQVSPLGAWQILWAVIGEGMGIEELIEIHVLPWERRYLGERQAWRFRDIGGPEALYPDQSSSERSALLSMQELLTNVSYEPGPIEWPARINALKRALNRKIRGRDLVQIDPECTLVRRTLRGGAHYPKDSNGQVVRTVQALKRVSGLYHNVLDALCHGAAVLFPVITSTPPPPKPKEAPSDLAWMGR